VIVLDIARGCIMKDLAKTTILVTGGAGFVGSNLVKRLLEAEVKKIHIVDNLLSAERVNVPSDHRVLLSQASITDQILLQELKDEYAYVFHLATYHGNQNSIQNPLADHENNTLTTLKLYERMKSFKQAKKVVYSSAGCTVAQKTFDRTEATTETDLVSLTMDSPYSMSKIFGEFYSNYYFQQHGLPAVRARFQNVYGPGEILGAGQWRGTPATVWRNVIPTFIYKALKNQPLPVENNGIATRDFIYVGDVVEGLIACALKGLPGQAYNIASGVETSVMDLAQMINELTGNTAPIELLPKRPWDNSGKRYGSTEKSKRELLFSARTNLRDGLTRTIAWTRENLDHIDKCITKHSNYIVRE
jgi:UDP-glucose 4-epimerase